MLELKIELVDGGELNFNVYEGKSFLQFNVKKKIYAKSYFIKL